MKPKPYRRRLTRPQKAEQRRRHGRLAAWKQKTLLWGSPMGAVVHDVVVVTVEERKCILADGGHSP